MVLFTSKTWKQGSAFSQVKLLLRIHSFLYLIIMINLGQAIQYGNSKSSTIKQDMQLGRIFMQGPGESSLETPRHSESEESFLNETPKISPRSSVQYRPSVQQKAELNSKLIKKMTHYKQDSFNYEQSKRPVQTETSPSRKHEEDKELMITQTRTRYGSKIDKYPNLKAGKHSPQKFAYQPKSIANAPQTSLQRQHPGQSHPAINHLTVQHAKMQQTTSRNPIHQLSSSHEQPQQPQSNTYDSLIQGLFGFVSVAKKYIIGGNDSMIATQNDTSLNQTFGSSFQSPSQDKDSILRAERNEKQKKRIRDTSSLNRLLNSNERQKMQRLSSEEDQQINFIISSPQDQGQNEIDNNNSHLSMPANAQNSYDSKTNRLKSIIQQNTHINLLAQSAVPISQGAHPKPSFEPITPPVLTSLSDVTEENGEPFEAISDTKPSYFSGPGSVRSSQGALMKQQNLPRALSTKRFNCVPCPCVSHCDSLCARCVAAGCERTSPRYKIRGGLTQDIIATIIEQSSVCEDSVSTIQDKAEENIGNIDSFYDCPMTQNMMTPLRQYAKNKKIIISSLKVDESGSVHATNQTKNGLIRHGPPNVTAAQSDLADGSSYAMQLPLFLGKRYAQAPESQSQLEASFINQECNQPPLLLPGELNVTNDLKQAFNEIFPSPIAQDLHPTQKVIELPRKSSKFDHNDTTEEAKPYFASFNDNSLRTHRSGHHIFQNRAGNQKEQLNLTKKSSDASSQTRKVQHIWKQRDKSLKSNADNPRNTYISQQIEPIESTFISEAEEINRLLEGNPQPEQIAKKLVEEKNKSQIFSELQRLDILARTLVEHEGFLIKFPQGKNSRKKMPRRFWCQIRDKKLKFYKDGPLKQQLSGTIDFDLHKCRPSIEDPQYSS